MIKAGTGEVLTILDERPTTAFYWRLASWRPRRSTRSERCCPRLHRNDHLRAATSVAKTATYTRAYATSKGFLTLLSDGDRLTGGYALGPEAGELMQQATLAIRARVPLPVLRDAIQPFPTFSEIYVDALKALNSQIAVSRQPDGAPATAAHAQEE